VINITRVFRYPNSRVFYVVSWCGSVSIATGWTRADRFLVVFLAVIRVEILGSSTHTLSIIAYILQRHINSLEQSPPVEGDSHSASQDILRPISVKPSHPIYTRYLKWPLQIFWLKVCMGFSPMRATCPTQMIFLDVITLSWVSNLKPWNEVAQ
jgi:hypothetical protein